MSVVLMELDFYFVSLMGNTCQAHKIQGLKCYLILEVTKWAIVRLRGLSIIFDRCLH